MQIQVLIHQQLSLLLIARQLQQELLRHSQERIIHVVIHQLQLCQMELTQLRYPQVIMMVMLQLRRV